MLIFYYSHGGTTARFVMKRLVPELRKQAEGLFSQGEGLDEPITVCRLMADGPQRSLDDLAGVQVSYRNLINASASRSIDHKTFIAPAKIANATKELSMGDTAKNVDLAKALFSPRSRGEKVIFIAPTYASLHYASVPEMAMPQPVWDMIEHLEHQGLAEISGVISCGNRNFGIDFCGSGAVTEYETIAQVELAGDPSQAANIAKQIINKLQGE